MILYLSPKKYSSLKSDETLFFNRSIRKNKPKEFKIYYSQGVNKHFNKEVLKIQLIRTLVENLVKTGTAKSTIPV